MAVAGACEPAQPAACESPVAEPADVVCAATPGANGGPAGAVFIALGDADAVAALTERLPELVGSNPGDAGLAGLAEVGPAAAAGVAGEDPQDVVVVVDEGFSFDASMVDADTRIEIVAQGVNTIALSQLADPPHIEVAELRVARGASLALSCDVRIAAQRLVIEAGATLAFHRRNDSGCVWSMPAATPEAGQPGGTVFVSASEIQLDGTIDVSGAAGALGQPGGSGGALTIVAETFSAGAEAAIVISGGAGGDGIDEAPC